VHVVDRPDEEVYRRIRGELRDQCPVAGADPFPFEADEDVDLRAVFGAQAEGFSDVGGVLGEVGGDIVAGCDLEVVLVEMER
jgi:hypothetical protein